jgi:hypothetical protein
VILPEDPEYEHAARIWNGMLGAQCERASMAYDDQIKVENTPCKGARFFFQILAQPGRPGETYPICPFKITDRSYSGFLRR